MPVLYTSTRILKPFKDSELTRLKVDIARGCGNFCCVRVVSLSGGGGGGWRDVVELALLLFECNLWQFVHNWF